MGVYRDYELTGLSRSSKDNLNVVNLTSDFVSRLRPGYHLVHQDSQPACDHVLCSCLKERGFTESHLLLVEGR